MCSFDTGRMITQRNLDVMIVGGGIGGLTLAQGLHRAGVAVTVYERTEARTDWLQGYRLHINPHGSTALRDCLPPAEWQAFLDTVSTSGGGFGFATEHLDDLIRFAPGEISKAGTDPAEQHYGVSRISLRAVLLSGLDDVVRLGKEFTHYEITPAARVTAYFADGTSATADVLIGADGANSRVRGQLLPDARRDDTGVTAIAGKHLLTNATKLPRTLTEDANMVVPAGRGFMFTAVWKGDRQMVPTGAPANVHADPTSNYTFWAYADASAQFPADISGMSGEALRRLCIDKTTGWSPAIRDLVAGSDPETVNALRIRSAAPVTPWESGPVTLLGDAIHNMTPMAGVGANTALRDADLLRRMILEVHNGDRPLIDALHTYEAEMLEYGFAAVKQSLRNAKQAASANRLGRAMFRTVLRTMNAVPPLKRRMAAQLGR
jgi:salicylate hydroxylase